MKAFKNYVVVESIDSDESGKIDGFVAPTKKTPTVGHYKVLSVGEVDDCKIKENDTIWVNKNHVTNSSNFDSDKIGIIRYDNIMAVD